MKYEIKDKHRLPLTFRFVDEYRAKNADGHVPYVRSKKYQTDFLLQVKPYKALVRLL